jgi:hypothetical protein
LHLGNAFFRQLHAMRAFKMERFRHDADGQDSALPAGLGDHARRAGPGSPAHPGGDEGHVRVVEKLHDIVKALLGGGASDFRLCPGAQTFGQACAKLNLMFCKGPLQGLRVRIADDEIDPDKIRGDHVIDALPPAPPTPTTVILGESFLLVSTLFILILIISGRNLLLEGLPAAILGAV